MLAQIYLGLVLFSILGSAVSRWAHLDPGPIAPVTSLLTLGVGCATVYLVLANALGDNPIRVVLPVLVFAVVIEVLGLYTGRIFGRYAYTSAWWPAIPLPGGHYFPLSLPFAWLMVVASAYLTCATLPNARFVSTVSALLAVGVDVVMEPVASGPLQYWRWHETGPMPGGVPILNSIAWFLFSLFVAWWLTRFPLKPYSRGPVMIVLGGHVALLLAIGFIRS